ncbi:MAG TPA: DUF6600 domain-containing protein [Pyrinomonadaceae bacterium]
MPLLLFDTVFANPTDDYIPDVTARVARISFLRGDAQIRRAGSDDWERASLNLPVVEGDQIATEANSRLEIQFDRDSFLRLAENSYLKIITLRDEGVALSLPQGTLSLRVFNFDKNRTYFEIDAPQTTVSVQKTGMYRLDAGDKDSTEVRVTATDGAEARVYSENSGFTLRNGRSALIYLDGSNAGEWDIADAARYADAWDEWVLERDARIAKLLRDAYYDKYYDRDVYGAEDLSDYGEWVYTKKYGWVWRPYRNSTAGYDDWSPYRYGQWRWIPPYGWTWVNDEPWGWATYHHGRWIYVDGDWCWTPYAYYRPQRSWWRPALVVVSWIGNNVCWYPLPYTYGYYNYNSHYHHNYHNNNNNNTGGGNPTPTPMPNAVPVPLPGKGPKVPPLEAIPPGAVVTVAKEQFGNQTRGAKTAPLDVAKLVLSKDPDKMIKEVPPLPVGIDRKTALRNEIIIEKPRVKSEPVAKTGVVERKVGVAMDEEIRQKKVFEDRKPVNRQNGVEPVKSTMESNGGNTEIRKTGAVERAPVRPAIRQDETNNNGNQKPRTENPVRPPRNNDQQVVKPRRDENQTPVYVPPPREETRERPRPPEPVRNEPRNERPREEPKPEPRREESKPAPKSDSKPESKPTPPLENKSKKDG